MRFRAVVAAAGVLLVLASCSSGTSGHGQPASALVEALGHVKATDTTRAWVEFGRPQATVAANGGSAAAGRYSTVVGMGLGDLGPVAVIAKDSLGVDPLTARSALTAGNPPDQGTVLLGVDTGPVAAKLSALGGKKDGDTWRLRPDHKFEVDDALGKAFMSPMTELDVVRLSDSAMAYASASAGLPQAAATTGSLADDAAFSAVAGCLGNPLGAVLADDAKHTGVDGVVGIGVSGTSTADAADLLCVATGSGDAANALAGKLRTNLATGVIRSHNQPWSQLLGGVQVDVVGGGQHLVRVTAHPVGDQPAGVFIRALYTEDLAGLLS